MNFFKKLFRKTVAGEQPTISREKHVQGIQENTDKLWKFIEETLALYNSNSCQCAYPRFRQVVSIDCTDYGKSFYCSETEGFISMSRQYFTITKTDNGPEADNGTWTCNKCGSTYAYGWADFSIHVNRTFLKIIELKTENIGANATLPIPLFVGIFGHSFPGKDILIPVDFETFKNYITALKD